MGNEEPAILSFAKMIAGRKPGAKRSLSFLGKCRLNATPAVRRLSPVITGTSVVNGAQLQFVSITSPSFPELSVVACWGRFPHDGGKKRGTFFRDAGYKHKRSLRNIKTDWLIGK